MKKVRKKKCCHYLAILYLFCCFGLLALYYPPFSLQFKTFSANRQNLNYYSTSSMQRRIVQNTNKLDSISIIGNEKLYDRRLQKVLLWTKYFGDDPLQAIEDYGTTQSRDCHVQCEFVSNRQLLPFADAVVFNSRDIRTNDLPFFHPENQLWIYLQQESPANTRPDLQKLPIIFNWTMTYRNDSDVFYPYGKVIPLIPNHTLNSTKNYSSLNSQNGKYYSPPSKIQKIYLKKTKLVAWVVSNCNTKGKREDFVNELQQYISVDIYGDCGDYECPRESEHECFSKIEKEYKFYLSFENSLCSEYVTEKLFNALNRSIVPVVYGYGNYTAIAPPDSYIDARSFQSPQKLAEYLLFLDKNPGNYFHFFKWKERYKVITSRSDGWCTLCDKLTRRKIDNKQVKRQEYADLWKWWNYFITNKHDYQFNGNAVNFKTNNFMQTEPYLNFVINYSEYPDKSEQVITVGNEAIMATKNPMCIEPLEYSKQSLLSKIWRRSKKIFFKIF